MIIIPQPPMLSGTTEEQVKQLKRYMNRLSETLSVWLNVDGGTTAAVTQSTETASGAAATLDSEVVITYGTFTITYAASTEEDATSTTTTVTFPSSAKFKEKPVVILSQPFGDRNVSTNPDNVTLTGFSATLPPMETAGSCTVMYAAIGKAQ